MNKNDTLWFLLGGSLLDGFFVLWLLTPNSCLLDGARLAVIPSFVQSLTKRQLGILHICRTAMRSGTDPLN